jgi:hypothetical protein
VTLWVKPTISTFSVTKGGRVEETRALFEGWELDEGLDENLRRFREQNPILAPTESWLKEMRRIFRARFGDVERHRPLVALARSGIARECWSAILLWHLTLRELLLSDFLEAWLFPRRQEGLLRVRAADVRGYLDTLKRRGLLKEDWSESTISRMASGLPAYASDFGLLAGKTVKEIQPYHLPDDALLYVLHAIAEETKSAKKIISDMRWRRYLLTAPELEQELMRLHQLQRLRYDVAGSLVHLELPFESVGEYVEHLVGH